jgi:hypothetical protein
MTYSELANFIEHEMKMAQVYQPVMLGLMLESEGGVVTEAETAAAFGAVQDDDREYDVRRYPGDVLVNHGVIERLPDGSSYRLIGFEDLTERERAVLVNLCGARLQVYLLGGDPNLEVGQLGPGRVYLLTNPAMPTLIKVGYTTMRAEYRAREISRGTGVPAPFQVYYESIPVDNAYQLEQEILRDFAGARPDGGREFLEIRVLREVIKRLPPEERDPLQELAEYDAP